MAEQTACPVELVRSGLVRVRSIGGEVVPRDVNHAEYKVLEVLVKKYPRGLPGSLLSRLAGCGDAAKTLKDLAARDPLWLQVIIFPGKPGQGGYRLR